MSRARRWPDTTEWRRRRDWDAETLRRAVTAGTLPRPRSPRRWVPRAEIIRRAKIGRAKAAKTIRLRKLDLTRFSAFG